MDETKGWIALYRSILDNESIWNDKPFARGQAWIELLLLANHKTKKIFFDGKVIEVERGSMITSMSKLALRWGWSRKKVTGFLNQLVIEEMITYKVVDRKYTLVTIVNYSKVQAGNELGQKRNNTIHTENTDNQRVVEVMHNEEEPLKNHRRTTEEPLKNINNNVNNINNVNNTHVNERVLGTHQNVRLKEFEINSLLREIGEDKFLKVVRRLDEYIERTGKAYYKSHFLVIKDWVIQAVDEDEKRETVQPVSKKKVNKFNDFSQRTYTKEELADLELKLLGLKK